MPITEYEICKNEAEATHILGHAPGSKSKDRTSTKKKKASSRRSCQSISASSASNGASLGSSRRCASGHGQGQRSLSMLTPQPYQDLTAAPGYLLDDNVNGASRPDLNDPLSSFIPVEQWRGSAQPNSSFNQQYQAYIPMGPPDDCGCPNSDDCACLGCGTHPDNPTTVAHVHETYRYGQPNSQDLPSPESVPHTPSGPPIQNPAAPQYGFFNPAYTSALTSSTSPAAIGGFDDYQFPTDGYFNNPIPFAGETSILHHQPSTPQSLPSGSIDAGRQLPYMSSTLPIFSGSMCPGQEPLCRCHICYCDGCVDHNGCNAASSWPPMPGLPSHNAT